MNHLSIFFILLFLTFLGRGNAQNQSNFKKVKFKITGDTLHLDSLSIVPNTVQVLDVAPDHYIIDFVKSSLVWKIRPNQDSVQISFRVFPINLSSTFQRRSFDSVFFRYDLQHQSLQQSAFSQKAIDFGKLNAAGSIGRSLSIGNRQDGILNSSLNLQLSGYMSDSVQINAAISDNNIPIQPDGNTQNLNEFDQIFIQFSKEKWKLSLGDLDIRQKQLYFLNFYKRLQGVSYENEHSLGLNKKGNMLASGAIAKGKFNINVFQGIEGNQGPYRLKGANQELFFIVLAGTERVYVDGVLQQRGEDKDYIINYNTAEITFMPAQMISKDKRIQVDFEYADRNYLNSQLLFFEKLELGQSLNLRVGYFSNTDAKNAPINQTLNNEKRQFLSSAGDNNSESIFPSAVRDSFLTGKILYKKVDTLYAPNRRDTVFVYDENQKTDLYSVTFYDVGQGNGDYVIDESAQANGRVYKWLTPDPSTGQRKGRFSPLVLLVPPKSQRMLSLASEWKSKNGWNINTDAAVSQNDKNRLSSVNDEDNQGLAGKIEIKKVTSFHSNGNFDFISNFAAEFASAQFKPVERLRSVEFYRDWGLGIIAVPANENILQATLGVKSKKGLSLIYDASRYSRSDKFSGVRNKFDQQLMTDKWMIKNSFVLTQIADSAYKGYFFRPVVDISRKIKSLGNQLLGIKYELERNLSISLQDRLINPLSFSFSNFSLFTTSDTQKPDKWGLRYFTRADALPGDNKLIRTDRSQNFNVFGELFSNQQHQFRINATYRNLLPKQKQSGLEYGSSILGRGEYNANIWKGGITGSMLYELGGGQEPQKDFVYFEVPAGQGEFAWIDYNNDGLQQLNEFEFAQFRDQARFIKLFTPSNQFVRTDYLQFNYNFIFNPFQALKHHEKSFLKVILGKFYFQSSLQIFQKNIAGERRVTNPFTSNFNDTSLLSFDRVQSHTLSFNKLSQQWGLDLNYLKSSNRAFLSYGLETRSLRDINLRIRSNWMKQLTVELILRDKENYLETPGFINRNYLISSFSTEPKLSFIKGADFRSQLSFRTESKKSLGIERVNLNSLSLDLRYNLFSKTAISLKGSSVKMEFTGSNNTSLGYIMLEGLQPGRNLIWNLDLTRRIGSYIEFGIQYEGRQTGVSKTMIHLGRAQFRALL